VSYLLIKKTSDSFFCVITAQRNITYSYGGGTFQSTSTHALLLRSFNIIQKYKFKSSLFYNLSFMYFAKFLTTKRKFISIFTIKGPRILAFLNTYRYWNELPFKKKVYYIFIHNKTLSNTHYKKQQSIKRRLKKKIIKKELYKD